MGAQPFVQLGWDLWHHPKAEPLSPHNSRTKWKLLAPLEYHLPSAKGHFSSKEIFSFLSLRALRSFSMVKVNANVPSTALLSKYGNLDFH